MLWAILRDIPKAQKWPSIVGLSSLAFLILARTIKTRSKSHTLRMVCCFAPVINLVLGGVVAYAIISGGQHIAIVGPLDGGLSSAFQVPTLDATAFHNLLTSCLAIAFLGYIESISVGLRFAAEGGYRVDPSQELIALGMANIAGAFCSGYPAAGIFPQTAIAFESGSKTPFQNIVVTLVIVIVLACLKEPLQYIPKSVLAAIVEVACMSLVEVHQFIHAWKVDRKDFLVMIITAMATFFVELEIGLMVGLLMSLIVLIHNLGQINTSLLGEMRVGSGGGPHGAHRPRVFRSISRYDSAQEIETTKVRPQPP